MRVKNEMINHSSEKKKKIRGKRFQIFDEHGTLRVELYFIIVYIKDYRDTIERKSRYAACIEK